MSTSDLVAELGEKLAGPELWWTEFQARASFSPKMRSSLYRALASLLRNGHALTSGLIKLHEVYQPQKHPLAFILESWIEGLTSGKTFSDAVQSFIPTEELVLISSGERANNLEEGLLQAAYVVTTKSSMKSVVSKSLAKPLFLLVLLIGLMIGFSLWMAPTFQTTFPADKFPPHVQKLFYVSDYFRDFWHVTVAFLAGLVVLISWSLNNWTGPTRERFDSFPPWSLFRTYNSASFMIALSSLLRAGVSLSESLKNIHAQSSPWMREHLEGCIERLDDGLSYREVFNSPMLDSTTKNMFAIYADQTEFDKAINSIGKEIIETSTESIQSKASLANVVALAFVALIIGWMYSSVMAVNQMTKDMTSQTQQTAGH